MSDKVTECLCCFFVGKSRIQNIFKQCFWQMKSTLIFCLDFPEEHRGKIICCIWVVSSSCNREKYSIKVSCFATPEDVIAEVIRKRTLRMNMTPEEQKQCVMEYQSSYVLKVCGCDQFLLERYPISQYKVSLTVSNNEMTLLLVFIVRISVIPVFMKFFRVQFPFSHNIQVLLL